MSTTVVVVIEDDCDSSALQWTSLIIAFISVNLMWWVVEIPKIWKESFKSYFKHISWHALRVTFPGVAVCYAFWHASEINGSPLQVYYSGVRLSTERQNRPRMTAFEHLKILASDGLTIIGTIISVYNACNLRTDEDGKVIQGQQSVASQVFPALPAAVYGLWLLAVSSIRWNMDKNMKFFWLLVTAIISISIPCVIISLILYYVSPLRKDNLWIMVPFCYIYQAVPFTIILGFWVPLLLLTAAVSFLARTGTVGISAVSANQFAPLCSGSRSAHVAFGAVYLAFGIVAAVLGLYGYFAFANVFGKNGWQGWTHWKDSRKGQPNALGLLPAQPGPAQPAAQAEEAVPMNQPQYSDPSKYQTQANVNETGSPYSPPAPAYTSQPSISGQQYPYQTQNQVNHANVTHFGGTQGYSPLQASAPNPDCQIQPVANQAGISQYGGSSDYMPSPVTPPSRDYNYPPPFNQHSQPQFGATSGYIPQPVSSPNTSYISQPAPYPDTSYSRPQFTVDGKDRTEYLGATVYESQPFSPSSRPP